MSSVDALWGVVAVIMIALFYRKSVSIVTHDKASFFKMLVVWVLALLLVYNIVDWALDHVPNNLRVQDIRGFTT
jgi:Na+/H+ antiporter NhaA